MSFQDLAAELVLLFKPLLDPLTRQALAMSCKLSRKHLGGFSPTILKCLPEAWKPWHFDSDPCGDYYYPLLYRAVREAPDWLHTWTMGTSKTIYRDGRMVLKLSWSPPATTSFVFYKLVNYCRGWQFKCSSMKFEDVHKDIKWGLGSQSK